MGGVSPWPTRWPEPTESPYEPLEEDSELEVPDYEIEEEPQEHPEPLPEFAPRVVTFAVTAPCNLRCDHCYDATNGHRRDLTHDQARAVIERLRAAGFEHLVFSGGEPLLRPDLFELIGHAHALGFSCAIRSNGTLIDEGTALRLKGLSIAGISLDGPNPQLHDAVRGPGSFERAVAGARLLVRAEVPVMLEMVLDSRNVSSALEMIELAEQLGATALSFSAMSAVGRARTLDRALTPGAVQQLLARVSGARARLRISPSCALIGDCVAGRMPNVDSEGYVSACYLQRERLFHILEVEPSHMRRSLESARATRLDGCGRARWLPSRKPSSLPILTDEELTRAAPDRP